MQALIKCTSEGYYWTTADDEDDDWMGMFATYEECKQDAETFGYTVGGDNYPK